MKCRLNPQTLASGILILAVLALLGSAAYKFYRIRQDTYLAGQPPKNVMEEIKPKSVPYDTIKPPAMTAADAFILGSPTSAVGMIFYGDYANPKSNQLFKEIEPKLRNFKNVRLTWKDLPSSTADRDPSFEAAVISECSRYTDPFWKLRYALVSFKNGLDNWTLDNLISQLPNNESATIDSCRRDKDVRANIRQAAAMAKGDGIDKAPFIFVVSQAIPSQNASSAAVFDALKNYLK